MNYVLTPSLEHIALFNISITLWNQEDIKILLKESHFLFTKSERAEMWPELEEEVIKKVPQLSLPNALKAKVVSFIKPIGLQILKWIENHDAKSYIRVNFPDRFFWTPLGILDKKKTAEIFVRDKSLEVTKRYILACIYCFQNDIPQLWTEMPEDYRKYFYSEDDPLEVDDQPDLVLIWTYDLKGEVAKMGNLIREVWRDDCSPYQYAFECAADFGKKSAAEYFLQKLTPKEKDESLVKSAVSVAKKRCSLSRNSDDLPKEHFAEMLCFLLSQMDEGQQIKVFKSFPFGVLQCLLDWPWQYFFNETAKRLWNFLSKDDYAFVLEVIVFKVIDGYKDYDYQKLFGEFWKQAPDAFKKYITSSLEYHLPHLFKLKNKENISLILRTATLAEKEKFLSSQGMSVCKDFIYRDEWDLLKFVLSELTVSQEAMIKFKQEFQGCVASCCPGDEFAENERAWVRFFQIIDDLILECSKNENEEEGDNRPAKKLCSSECEKTT